MERRDAQNVFVQHDDPSRGGEIARAIKDDGPYHARGRRFHGGSLSSIDDDDDDDALLFYRALFLLRRARFYAAG